MRSRPRLARGVAAAAVLGLLTAVPLIAQAAPAEDGSPATAEVPTKTVIPLGKVTATLKPQTEVRFATFNVRTSRADRGTSRHWLHRAGSVAREIKSQNPGIVAIQELGPGRADGKKGSLHGRTRQTTSLENALSRIGASKYVLTRETAYVRPGTNHGTQGARILYDKNRFTLLSSCRETTGSKNYNPSCGMDMPIMGGDGKGKTRSAAYAQFKSKATGKKFWVISVHLDERHSGSSSRERALDNLRRAQIRAVYNRVQGLNSARVPVIVGGDINSWRTKSGTDAPRNYLIGQGLRDSVGAPTKIDARYPTVNHWKRVLRANAPGRQVALDVVMVKGTVTFSRYENVMQVSDPSRPSDHNMVTSDMVLEPDAV